MCTRADGRCELKTCIPAIPPMRPRGPSPPRTRIRVCSFVPEADDRIVPGFKKDPCSKAALGPLYKTNSIKRDRCRKYNTCSQGPSRPAHGPIEFPVLPHCPAPIDGDWERKTDCFNFTKTGYLGTHRRSMLKNKLLILDEVGESKYKYCEPPPDTRHGGSSGQASSTLDFLAHKDWDCKKQGSSLCNRKPQENYIALNRAGVASGVVSLRDVRDFRNTHSMKIRRPNRKFVEIPDIVHGNTSGFGHQNDHTRDVITTRPLAEWITCIKVNQHQALSNKLMIENLARRSENNAYQLRMIKSCPKVEEEPELWKIPRFQRVKPRVSTFRCVREGEAIREPRLGDAHILGDRAGLRLAEAERRVL